MRRLWPWPKQHLPHHTKTCFPSICSVGIASSSNSPSGSDGVNDKEVAEEMPYADVSQRGRRWEKKPYPTLLKELICRAKEEHAHLTNPCRYLEQCPTNSLLVSCGPLCLACLLAHPSFHDAIHHWRFCEELHIGRGGGGYLVRSFEGPESGAQAWAWEGVRDVARLPYCYHLHDRVGKLRLPAVAELYVQAGLDLDGYLARRRTKPMYSINGRIVDFEPEESTFSALTAGSLPPIAPTNGNLKKKMLSTYNSGGARAGASARGWALPACSGRQNPTPAQLYYTAAEEKKAKRGARGPKRGAALLRTITMRGWRGDRPQKSTLSREREPTRPFDRGRQPPHPRGQGGGRATRSIERASSLGNLLFFVFSAFCSLIDPTGQPTPLQRSRSRSDLLPSCISFSAGSHHPKHWASIPTLE
ncbi:hypothetical protein Taro_018625 [Colocasia esculenta]|uniref:APO domain-containing protein n=1 Tax=Colocasia esculenta TaxID=4460 RepID=A0A843UJ47_COLES|nr:hypothetical protein [Colocasia esculenta]